jgi:Tc toxin complex TcA C-terminal TcB-binding domain/Putative peptidoglycan binding domain
VSDENDAAPALDGDVLALGASGDEVADLQRELAAAGFDLDRSELLRSYFGPSTKQAIALVQKRIGLDPTGVVDAHTLKALRARGEVRLAGDERGLADGRVLDDATDTPAAGVTVRAFALKADEEGDQLAEDVTNADGAFVLALGAAFRKGALRLHVLDAVGTELLVEDLRVPADILILRLPRPRDTITEAAAVAKLELPDALKQTLAAAGLVTIADLRTAGGLARRRDLPVPADDPSVRTLDALAGLSVLPADLATTARLANAGLTSIVDVAATPVATLVATVDGLLDRDGAAALNDAARAETGLLLNSLTEVRTRALNGTATWAQALDALTRTTCGCKDCQQATSRLAYLADLLAYTIAHVLNNGSTIGTQFLQSRFHQPFGDIPAACASLDRRVREVRIAIEGLRAHLGLTNAPPNYLLAAYNVLLERNGTSYDELRRARKASAADRLALGRRLGIEVPPHLQPNDPLDVLLLDEHAPPGPKALTEEALEHLFGLPSTLGNPLRSDPVPACFLYAHRRNALETGWLADDWPATPPPGLRPLIDPDLLGPSDFTTPDDPSASNVAYEIFERRTAWIANRIDAKDQERRQFSFDQMLGDQPVSGLNRPTSVTELFQLKAKREGGTPIDSDLQGLGLDQAGFDFIVGVVELDQQGLPVHDSEWYQVNSILTQTEKRGQFPAWRAEEQARPAWMPATAVGDFPLVLGPKAFRLRPSVAQGGYPWSPTPWRSTNDDRRRWVRTLRTRIERMDALQPQLHQAVDAAEDKALVLLRDWLVSNLPQPSGTTKYDWFTRHFQIDAHSDACRMTTRAEQAIETLQGILFGARNGLLEDPSLTLDADSFDAEWTWIGSYVTWRAATLVFIYPERVLRPSLRRSQTPGFAALLATARAGSGVDRESAVQQATAYGSYFADVCSLVPVAARRSGSAVPDTPGPQGQPRFRRRVIAIGQAGASGAYYFSSWDELLQQSLFGPPSVFSTADEAYWTNIAGLRSAARPLGMLTYQVAPRTPLVGLYLRETQIGQPDRFYFTSYDGDTWTEPDQIDPPALVRLSETIGELTAASAPLAGAIPWTTRADDRVFAADVDGDGASEIVALAATPAADGRLPVAILREQDGALVTSWSGFVAAGWNMPASGPVLLRTSSINARQRLLLVNAAVPALGLLGWDGTQLTLITTATTGLTPDPAAIFAGADLDSNGADELVAFSHRATGAWYAPTATDVNVLTVSDTGFALRGMQTLVSDRAAHISSSRGGLTGPEGFDVAVDRAITIRGRSAGNVRRDEVLVTWRFPEYGPAREGAAPDLIHDYVAVLAQDGPPAGPLSVRLYADYVKDASGSLTWVWQPTDRFVALGEAVAVIGPNGIGVLKRTVQHDLILAWMTATALPAPVGTLVWIPAATDRIVAFDVDGDGADELLVAHADASAIAVLSTRADGSLEVRWSDTQVQLPDAQTAGWTLTSDTAFVAADLDGDGADEIVAYGGPAGGGARVGLFRAIPRRPFPPGWTQTQRFGPVGVTQLAIEPKHSTPGAVAELTARRARIASAYTANTPHPANLRYLDEAYYFVPVELALRLATNGDSTAALDWFASVYDYVRAVPDRKIAFKLTAEESEDLSFERVKDWLDDPLDPHAIAATRRNTYTRYTIVEIANCLVADGDVEFTRGTSESVARAEELYLAALALLGAPELAERSLDCGDLIGELDVTVGDPEWVSSLIDIKQLLEGVTDRSALESAVPAIQAALSVPDAPVAERFAKARGLALKVAEQPPPRTFDEVGAGAAESARTATAAALTDPKLADAAEMLGLEAKFGWGHFVPAPSFEFCIPPDPRIETLRRHIELSLKKIRSCRTISGTKADIDPYALPTIAETGLEAAIPVYDLQPLPYRYATLVERAKQLVGMARQIEQSMVSALEAGFLASYTEFLARQDLELALAGTRLKELEVVKAADGVALAELQRDKAQMVRDHVTAVMQQAQSDYSAKLTVTELQAGYYAIKGIIEIIMAAYGGSASGAGASGGAAGGVEGFDFGALISSAGSSKEWGSAFGDLGTAIGKVFDAYNQMKSFEAVWKEYQYQGQVADQDIRIGGEQVAIAVDTAAIAGEEHAISVLKVEQAATVLDFLTTKRALTPDVYEWMAGVLQDVYRFFLQEATSIALLAERQLAFERQEVPPAFIQSDYWQPPADAAALARAQGDLKGLTGAERLLRDVSALDEYAFRTDQRKLQLQKTISAWQTDPFSFVRFRRTGVLRLATPAGLFDRERPGEYLRLVKRVRVSVIALIPPGQGIQGTLETTGTSRVVIGGDTFRTVSVQRGPEAVGLTKAIDTTGLFELDAQSELLAPFEGIGVDTTWQLTLPKAANPFDYDSIVDVLLTLEYTALSSSDYREQVIGDLDPEVNGDRAFSLRREMPDQWTALHGPAGTMTVSFRTEPPHFPPNVGKLEIRELALYFVASDGATTSSWPTDLAAELDFQPDDGSAAFSGGVIQPVDGLIGTLTGNAQPWTALVGRTPLGEWTLSLPDTAATRQLFADEAVRDILFAITYGGELPPWPE